MSRRQNYSVEELKSAVSAVKRTNISIKKIALDFGIPRKTLSDHVNGKFASHEFGPDRMLTTVEELSLVEYLKYISKQGFPMTRAMVRSYVVAMVRKSGRNTLFNMDKGPSDNWFRKFLNRHPELSERLPEPQDRGRARMANATVMKQYFDLLAEQMTTLELKEKPGQVFNCDETGWSGKERSKQKVIGMKGCHTYQQAVTSPGHITAHLCISADGKVLPTFLIFEKTFPHTSYKDGVPGNWMYGHSDSGYMDTELFVTWFRDMFIPNCGRERPVLLVMDNHDSHISLQVVKLAMENNITLLGLPPHTTHILQPLDVSINGPLKAKFQSLAVSLGFLNKQQVINKAKFPVVLSYAIDQHMSPAHVKNAFRKSGLYPPNRDAIDKSQVSSTHIVRTEPSTSAAAAVSAVSCCPTCGSFVGDNPLVKEGLVPSHLADLFPAVPCKPQTASRRKLVTEARVITSQAFYQKLDDRQKESARRKEEVEKRKEERQKRKSEKELKGKAKKQKTQANENTSDSVLTDLEVCHCCQMVDPVQCSEGGVDWVECDLCEEWYHQVCVGLQAEGVDTTHFICESCAGTA